MFICLEYSNMPYKNHVIVYPPPNKKKTSDPTHPHFRTKSKRNFIGGQLSLFKWFVLVNPLLGNTSCENVYEEGITYFGEQVLITLYHSSYWSADQHSTDINARILDTPQSPLPA